VDLDGGLGCDEMGRKSNLERRNIALAAAVGAPRLIDGQSPHGGAEPSERVAWHGILRQEPDECFLNAIIRVDAPRGGECSKQTAVLVQQSTKFVLSQHGSIVP
jgi:hypothetical protein